MKNQNKAQMDPKGLIVFLVGTGIIAIVGLLIFSQVSKTSGDLFATTNKYANNESVTISSTDGGDNSTLLAQSGYVTNSETVINDSNGYLLTRDIDYKITVVGTSGEIDARGNFTLINASNASCSGCGFNNTALDVSYRYVDKDDARKLKESDVDTTTLDAMNLAVVGLIVLAAVTILTAVYWIGKK